MKNWNLDNGYQIYRLLGGRSNVYLIITGNANFLVDTGRRNHKAMLDKRIQLLTAGKIDFLLLTHTHFDHCENAVHIRNTYGAKIVTGHNAIKYSVDGCTLLPHGTNRFSRLLTNLVNRTSLHLFKYECFTPDLLVGHYYSFSALNYAIEIVNTPGHSDDSVAVIVNNEIALTGDTLFGIFKNSVFPPFANDIVEMLRSWETLVETRCRLFLPGHGRQISRVLLEKELSKHSQQ